jgi:hypothetical protein
VLAKTGEKVVCKHISEKLHLIGVIATWLDVIATSDNKTLCCFATPKNMCDCKTFYSAVATTSLQPLQLHHAAKKIIKRYKKVHTTH